MCALRPRTGTPRPPAASRLARTFPGESGSADCDGGSGETFLPAGARGHRAVWKLRPQPWERRRLPRGKRGGRGPCAGFDTRPGSPHLRLPPPALLAAEFHPPLGSQVPQVERRGVRWLAACPPPPRPLPEPGGGVSLAPGAPGAGWGHAASAAVPWAPTP